jgi:hypothetical protein
MKHPRLTLNCITVTTVGLFALAQSLYAQLPMPVYDPFPASYTNGGAGIEAPQGSGISYPSKILADAVNNIQTVWSLNAGTGGGSAQILGGPAALSYPDLAVSASPSVGVYIRTNNTSGNRSRGILFETITNGSVYMSCLINVEQFPSPSDTGPRIFALLSGTTNGAQSSAATGLGVGIDSSSNVVVSLRQLATANATSASPLTPGTHLIVARYTFNPNANTDVISVWIDPGSLGVAEGSEPETSINITNTGIGDQPSLSSFYINHPSTEVVVSMFIDEVRLGTNWAQVTPTGVICSPAGISSHPSNASISEGGTATFSAVGTGSSPTYQWQISTNGGSTWNNVTVGSGTNALVYRTHTATISDNNNEYRCVVAVSCGGGSTTNSNPAILTVNTVSPTPVGVILDDTWSDGDRITGPISSTNSVWYASSGASLSAASDSMTGVPAALWIGYFTEDTNTPVHLAVGRAIKAKLVFTTGNVVSQTNNGIRFGLFSYADGGIRVTNDNFGTSSSGNGANVTGYIFNQNFCSPYLDDKPQVLYARSVLGDNNLIGTIGNYLALGSGPATGGFTNAPGIQSSTTYTLEMTFARIAETTTEMTTSLTGGGTNWTTTVTDTNFYYHRFDAIAIRPFTPETTTDSLTFTQFKVEVIATAPAPIPLNIVRSGTNVVLSWTDPSFALVSYNDVNSTTSNRITGSTSPYTNTITGNRQFFRLVWP